MTLDAKLDALHQIADRAGLPASMADRAAAKVAIGHAEHGDDCEGLDLEAELRDELADVAGYGALLFACGRWSWRIALAVRLAGIGWRLCPRQ